MVNVDATMFSGAGTVSDMWMTGFFAPSNDTQNDLNVTKNELISDK